MLKVGSKVKLNVEVLEKNGFEELNETDVLFIRENPNEIYEIEADWNEVLSNVNSNIYRYMVHGGQFSGYNFKADELVLVEENAE